MVVTEREEGWGFPGNSKKAHYFVDGMALCRKWGFYSGPLEKGNDNSPDNCAECKRLLSKRKPSVV
jgi:hypothetical protein